MNGILVVDKEKGYTSRDIVNIVSKKLGTKKVGHTGTLDPIATGVLVLCIGKSLKLTELLVSNDKVYEAVVKLGIETDTLDVTGRTVVEEAVGDVDRKRLIEVLDSFKGKIKQEVPKYSAVSVNGKRLYEYARKGIEVELPVREVEIYDIELVSDIVNNEFTFRCRVSKGTYIRSLIRDIGYNLGTVATMKELRRIKQGIFDVKDAFSLNDINNDKFKIVSPMDILDIPKVIVDRNMEFRIRNGQVLKKFFDSDMAMILNEDKELLAIYKRLENDFVKPYKMF